MKKLIGVVLFVVAAVFVTIKLVHAYQCYTHCYWIGNQQYCNTQCY
jgi:hypothetical protein